jgi:hypothetical protein
MKVEIPPEAFEKGDCRIEAWLMNGTDVVGKSESTVIRCVASGK